LDEESIRLAQEEKELAEALEKIREMETTQQIKFDAN
jgi:hypothetical protein